MQAQMPIQVLQEKIEPYKTNYSHNSADIFRISFVHFFFGVFALGVKAIEGVFDFGEHLVEWCYRLQRFNRTGTVAPRLHLKTTINLGYLAWRLYRMDKPYNEWLYMAYKGDLAEHQLKRLKRYIRAIPEYFNDLEDLTNAESILHYSRDGKEFICEPEGILSFKRGRHPNGLICDDILRDPEVKLDISQLQKIERTFLEEVESMPKEELHVFGTSQDREDLFKKLEGMPSYNCKRYPAITNHAEKRVLWPEVFPFERLTQIKADIGEKAFNKEYMCRPVKSEEGFFKEEDLDKIIKNRLKNYDIFEDIKLKEFTYGGFDIGKKTHPSHLAIFGVSRNKRLIQIHSKWFDGWNYVDQLAYLKEAIIKFKMAKLPFDNTRAEFESFYETGELPGEMEGITFTNKNKFAMATEFDKTVTQGRILLLPDQRQKRQLLNVDNDLKAVETEEGHGDCFWSICLAIHAASQPMPNIKILNLGRTVSRDEDFGWRDVN